MSLTAKTMPCIGRAPLQITVAKTHGIAKMAFSGADDMQTMSTKDAKNSFGLLLDRARAEPVRVEKHGRPVVVSVEEFQRLSLASGRPAPVAELHGRTGS